MKARMSIKNIIFIMLAMILASMFFINICFATNTGKVIVDTAKLREQPNTNATVLELLTKGNEVEILEEQEDWYKVKYKKITGYIRADLIETSKKPENTETLETVATATNETAEQPTENPEATTNNEQIQEEGIEVGKQYKIVQNVRLKAIPLISAIELDEIGKDVQIEVTEILNDWAKIKTAEGKEGWLITKNLTNIQTESKEPEVQTTENLAQATEENTKKSQKTKKMYVNSQTVNVREQANKSSKAIKQISLNTEVTVISTENGWAYVEINGTKGYIAENLLSSTKKETSRGTTTARETDNTTTNKKEEKPSTTTKPDTSSNTTSAGGSSVVSYAKQFIGSKYKYGGTTPSGFDCSGFTQYIYKNFGVNLNRTAAAQYSNGVAVTQLQAGDLVMFGKSGINHVGIYIGGNSFIHAANPSKGVRIDSISSAANERSGVRIDSLSTGYYKTNYVGARRIF